MVTAVFLILVLVMITLNSINSTSNWIENRKTEIIVRKITGATDILIFRKLLTDYFVLITISFVFGFIISFGISHIEITLFAGFDFSPLTALLAYFMVLLFGIIASATILVSQSNDSFSKVR